jgi:hypothetical protein
MPAITMQSPIAITVDTAGFRANSPALSPNQKKLQQRIAGWAPTSPTEMSFSDKIEGASRRRHSLVERRTSKLQETNTRASVVAEQARRQFADALSGKAAHVAAKEASAEQKRKARVSAIVSSAATHTEHARSVAEQQTALKKQKTEQAISGIELRANEAGQRRAKLLAEQKMKAATEVAKAKLLADAKRQQQLELRVKNEDKLAAAEARRLEIHHQLACKLAESDEHARQVRRNKGSTPARTTVNAEKKIDVPGVAFDMDVRSPPSPNKTPVQMRLEERAAKVNFNDDDDDDAAEEDKIQKATRRRLSLVEEKTATLSKTNETKKEVVAKQHEAEVTKQVEAAKQAAAKIKAAEERRIASVRAKAEKAAGHVEAAKATSKTVKSGQEEALAERKRRLSKELLEHDERRAAALKAKAAPLSPRRTPQKQKQQQQLASTGDDDA